MTFPSSKTVEREPPGYVTAIGLSDAVSGLATDLLFATTRDEFLKVADHLRLLGQQVEQYVERIP